MRFAVATAAGGLQGEAVTRLDLDLAFGGQLDGCISRSPFDRLRTSGGEGRPFDPFGRLPPEAGRQGRLRMTGTTG